MKKPSNRALIGIGGIGMLTIAVSGFLTLQGYNEILRFQIFSLTDIRFWGYFLLTMLVSFYSFFIPGDLLIRSYVKPILSRLVLSFSIGMVMWGFQGFIFGFFDVRFLTYGYLVIALVLWLLQHKYVSASNVRTDIVTALKKIDRIAIVIVTIGTAITVLPLWFSGYISTNGVEFCCFWPDNLYHLAIVNQLVLNMPPIEPGASGVIMQNYHYFANLIMADIVRVFHIPLVHLQNQYMPIFISILFASSAALFAVMLAVSKNFTRWLLFFLLFSGDIIFVVLLLLGKPLNFSVGISENAATLWFSPPRVFAMLIVFTSLSLFLLWLKNKSTRLGMIFACAVASLIGMKVYIGAFLFFGLGGVGLYFLWKREWRMVVPLIMSVIIGLAIYLPVNPHSGALVFTGLWRVEDFAVKKEFGLLNIELARYIFLADKNYIRVILIEILYSAIFLISLFGMFLIGIVQTRKSIKSIPYLVHVVLLLGMAMTIPIGLFFIQETGGANTSQFFMSVYIAGSVYAALACQHWMKRLTHKKLVVALICIVVLLTSAKALHETYENIRDIATQKEYLTVPKNQYALYQYIRTTLDTSNLIIANPEFSKENNCYIFAYLSNHVPFICGSGILADHGVKTDTRLEILDTVFTNKDPNVVLSALTDNGITHLYITDPQKYAHLVNNPQYEMIRTENNAILLKIR